MVSTKSASIINPVSIIAQVVAGSIKIDDIEEFDTLLGIFPDDPELNRAYSDLLCKKNKREPAAEYYGRTARMYIDHGMLLQAVVSKMHQWKIYPPSDLSETHAFFSLVHKTRFPELPINLFFPKLSYAEIFAFINNMEVIRLNPGEMFKKNGDNENALFMVVSGGLRETAYRPVKQDKETLYEKNMLKLFENDFFGDYYPFEEKNLAQSYIEALTRTELVKISKANLIKICNKYQDVELAINDLKKSQSETGKTMPPRLERQGSRHYLPTKVQIRIFADSTNQEPVILEGYSLDLSIGGACILLDSIGENNGLFSKAIHHAAVQLSLPMEAMSLVVSGAVVWSKAMRIESEDTFALGIKFEEMSPKLRGIIFAFADSICSKKEFLSFSPFKVH